MSDASLSGRAGDPPVFTAVVADDMPSVRTLIAHALERTEAIRVVAEAGDGDEAVAAVERHLPDVVVLDLEMPRRGGLDVVPDLRTMVPRAVIAVFSGLGPAVRKEDVLAAGADLYVEKMDSLDNFVAELLAELTFRRVTGDDGSI
jgi:DNA-binding NarL/FixJ family response regulator